jgi:hypothetical protein
MKWHSGEEIGNPFQPSTGTKAYLHEVNDTSRNESELSYKIGGRFCKCNGFHLEMQSQIDTKNEVPDCSQFALHFLNCNNFSKVLSFKANDLKMNVKPPWLTICIHKTPHINSSIISISVCMPTLSPLFLSE